MKKHTLKFRVIQERNGASLRTFTAPEDSSKFIDTGLQVNGILDEDGLRKALRTQFDFVLDQIVEELKEEVEEKRNRVEHIRIKGLEATRRARSNI